MPTLTLPLIATLALCAVALVGACVALWPAGPDRYGRQYQALPHMAAHDRAGVSWVAVQQTLTTYVIYRNGYPCIEDCQARTLLAAKRLYGIAWPPLPGERDE